MTRRVGLGLVDKGCVLQIKECVTEPMMLSLPEACALKFLLISKALLDSYLNCLFIVADYPNGCQNLLGVLEHLPNSSTGRLLVVAFPFTMRTEIQWPLIKQDA